jgi:hypothetical protein
VFGIVGLALCQLVAPLAWIRGSQALAEIDGAPGFATNRGMIEAGRICGIIGTVLLALPMLGLPLVFLLRSAG